MSIWCISWTICCRPIQRTGAIRLIEGHWETIGRYHVLPVGRVEVVRSAPTRKKGQVSIEELPAYETLREEKAIRIIGNVDLTSSRNSLWNDFLDLCQDCVVRRLDVTVVESHEKKLLCPDYVRKAVGHDLLLCVDAGTGSVEEIVRSQRFQLGTRQLWLLMGNHHWKWSDTERRIREAQGRTTDEKLKFMALAVRHDFAKEWRIHLVDDAPRDGVFPNQATFDRALKGATVVQER